MTGLYVAGVHLDVCRFLYKENKTTGTAGGSKSFCYAQKEYPSEARNKSGKQLISCNSKRQIIERPEIIQSQPPMSFTFVV